MTALLLGGTAAAQSPGTREDELNPPLLPAVELGGFGQFTSFDDNAGRANAVPKDGFGYGGRIGVFLFDSRWQLEGDGYRSAQGNDSSLVYCCGGTPPTGVDVLAFALRLNYNLPLGNRNQLVIGAGPVLTNYKYKGGSGLGIVEGSFTSSYGASGIAGLRLRLANRISIRADGVVDYMPRHEPEPNMNLHGRAGLSFVLGGARPEAMCTYAGLESIPASSPNCVAPPPPAPPPPPPPRPAQRPAPLPATCRYDARILASDPRCVAPVAIPPVDTATITGPIYFDFDKLTIRPDAAATLDRMVRWLQANPGMRIRIEGNADERGSDEYNLALGQRRAASAKRYLVERGIAADRLDVVSYGEERPVCAGHDEACWRQNRRADFRIVTIGGDGTVRRP